LEVLRPADEEQERWRLEDLLEKVGPAGRFPQTPQNCATFRAVRFASQKISGSSLFAFPMWIALCCLSLFCRVL
jgi:hypothetical protein